MFYQDILKNKLLETNTRLPSILDMCYLAGKIYEDPEKDTGLQCTLPEGSEVFQNCSSLHENWQQYYREYEKDSIKIALNFVKSSKKYLEDEITKVTMSASTIPDVNGVYSNIQNSLTEDIKNDQSNVESNFKELSSITKESTGFKIALYVNNFYNCSVLAIRGTEPTDEMTLWTDVIYTLNVIPEMYKQAVKFYTMVSVLPIVKKYPLVACTGHSLGGIMAKMIAPTTGLSTYTFNSPGVLQILKKNKLPTGLKKGQEVLTFIATADPVGHLRSDNDLGKPSDHILLPVLNGKNIPVGSVKFHDPNTLFNGINITFASNLKKNGVDYHGIVDMFNFLKRDSSARIYRTRKIKLYEK